MSPDDLDFLALPDEERVAVLAHAFETYLRGFCKADHIISLEQSPLTGLMRLVTTTEVFVARVRPTYDLHLFLLGLTDRYEQAEAQAFATAF